MKLLLLASVFWAIAHSLPSKNHNVRSSNCIDPTFACQDLYSARSCGVVKDCIHDIWATLHAPEDNNEICDLCKQMVKEARDQLLSNETQEEIKEVFEGSCELIPIKVVADACKQFFDDIIPDIIEMLASRMDPNMVCTVAGLCNNAALKEITKETGVPFLDLLSVIGKNDYCADCKSILKSVKQIILSIPQDEMKTMLLKACDQFPEASEQCEMIVRDYLPLVYDYVTTMDPASTCDTIGICGENNAIKPFSKHGDDLTCEFCESLVQHLRDEILTNTTKEEFKTALLNLCSRLGNFATECKDLVNDYYDMLYDFLDKTLNPKALCTDLGLCKSESLPFVPEVKITPIIQMWNGKHPERKTSVLITKTKEALPTTLPAVKIVPAKTVHKKLESNEISKESVQQLPINRMMHPLLMFQKDTECAFCKAVMFFLKKDLTTRNKKDIETVLNEVCDKWIPGFTKECGMCIENNYDKIVELLMLGVDYNEICNHLKLCQSEKLTNVKVIPPQPKNDIECEICEKVMAYLENELKARSTEAEIRQALDKVCTILPQSMAQECKDFVKQYTDIIISLILKEVDPSVICDTIHLCPNMKKVSSPLKNDIECDLCEKVMGYLENELKKPSTEAEIKQALDEVCNVLPQSISSDCRQFVNEYTDVVIQLILQEIDPLSICNMIGLCSKKSSHLLKDTLACDLCKQVMGYLKKELQDPTIEDDIRKALDEVCNVLPKSLFQQCKSFVDEYTNLIVSLLVQEIDPDEVCTMIKLCPQTKTIQFIKADSNCELCQTIMSILEDQLKDHQTEAGIRQLLDEVCSILPQNYAVKCQHFVDKYTEKIITFLLQNVDPKLICTLLEACPTKDIKCTLCQYAAHFLQGRLMNNATDEEIKKEVDKLCSYLPDFLANECTAFVDEYGDAILVLIAQELDPTIVCPALNLCPSKYKSKIPAIPLKKVKTEKCTLCETIVDNIDKLLEDDDVDKEITQLATKVCGILSGSAQQECVSIVEIYGPYFLQMIGQLANSKEVCQSIDLCARVPGHVHLLGGEKCTFGPDYWCKSRAHAASCKAEDYCTKKVWKN